MVIAALLVCQAATAEVPDDVIRAEKDRIAAIDKARAATLAILAHDGQNGGSGVLISPDGYALSNFHVTAGCGDWMRCGTSDGKLHDAVIVGIDPVGDVALIKLVGRTDFPAAEWGDSERVRVGDRVFACGNPFLLATDFSPSVSFGIVSGVRRYQYPDGTLLEYADCIQTDAAINPLDRAQWPRIVRETRPRERRRGLRHFRAATSKLSRAFEGRPDCRSCHARRRGRQRQPRARHRG
jgi:hypothetical protein